MTGSKRLQSWALSSLRWLQRYGWVALIVWRHKLPRIPDVDELGRLRRYPVRGVGLGVLVRRATGIGARPPEIVRAAIRGVQDFSREYDQQRICTLTSQQPLAFVQVVGGQENYRPFQWPSC
jgi:hypothetical protein